MKTDWVNVAHVIMALTVYAMSAAVISPIALIGKDPAVPPYKVLMDIFVYIELVGGGILAFGFYLLRRARKRGGRL